MAPIRCASRLITSGAPGHDCHLDETRLDHSFRFINKIWQMTNFVNMNLDGDIQLGAPPTEQLDLPSRWILSRLQNLVANVRHLFEIYQYGEAGNQIQAFMWDELAPFYVEVSKNALYDGSPEQKETTRRVLVLLLDTCLRLLHPFMPFMTEEAWRYLPHEGEALIIADWPESDEKLRDADAETLMTSFLEVVREIRNTRAEYNVDPGRRIQALIRPGQAATKLVENAFILKRLCNVERLDLLPADSPDPENAASIVVGELALYLPLEGMLDIAAERQRLATERAKLQQQLERSLKMLGNANFLERARPDVVERERNRKAELESATAQIDERLANLGGAEA